MKNKSKILIFILLITLLSVCFCSCEEPETQTPPTPTATPIPTAPLTSTEATNTDTETPEPDTALSESPEPTPTPTPEKTWDPRYDSENTIGPYTFGENTYKIYIGETLTVFNSDKTVYLEIEGINIVDKELFALTVSLIDINFDEIPDFSYFENDGRRICYLSNDDGSKYTFSHELSNLYKLSRCYETQELYALVSPNSNEYNSYKFVDGEFVLIEELADNFTWDMQAIAYALAGENASFAETESAEIRGVMCKTYIVGGYITVATDSYGNYYIKDMPHRGFCRLSLNPNGRWSKSEKVTADMF